MVVQKKGKTVLIIKEVSAECVHGRDAFVEVKDKGGSKKKDRVLGTSM